MIMSWVGMVTGLPSAGLRMLFVDSIKILASACASADSGTCTAIWSPSKSALKAVQTSGWIWIALPSTSCGSKALLALEHVGQRLERAVARTSHGPPTPAIVEQRVHGLLEHPLLVVHDDLGCTQVKQPLEPVVPVDDAPVQVVQVRGGEPAAVQLHHRPQGR